ncbi:MAG: NAD(+) synthase [Spirochaeta sp. LUC14_002_19_P3]|nr:MAG: NAD(+) synthase [Spirochaeta sp. LUC14_002_19_P3]
MSTMGYFRVAAAVPEVKPAAVRANGDALLCTFFEACEQGADLVLFPELALSGYSCGDLFLQTHLIQAAREEALRIIEAASAQDTLIVFGLPLSRGGRLYNTAVVAAKGHVLGIVPKTCIPNAREYYEQRWFSSADEVPFSEVRFGREQVPFGSDLLFRHKTDCRAAFAVEICEDLWSPIPPSSRHAIAGAQLIFNLSASNEFVGKADYRRALTAQQSARCMAGYVYVSAGIGESTTDTVYGGHAIIAENGRILAESERFRDGSQILLMDIDTDLLDHERRVSSTFRSAIRRETDINRRVIHFSRRLHEAHEAAGPGRRPVSPHPFVPDNAAERDERCREISAIQSAGLAARLKHTGLKAAVIGLSGGLDSTLALLVAIGAFKRLNLPLEGLYALTMPGFGTTGRTQGNAEKLCSGFGLRLETLDIRVACEAQMKDLNHSGEPSDRAYENIQARHRTAILMNKANMVGGLLVGTGDLSELALGWCTYNGDHISHYAVNCGVPKTLVRCLISWAAETWAPPGVKTVLEDILATPVSPELLPPGGGGEIVQKTEEEIGPYELHDFFLYYAIRHGFAPAKVLHLAETAFNGAHDASDIKKWLRVFYTRFFSQQFKRSCLPDGPKVGTIALSPRADWRMPSDADVSIWLEELDKRAPLKNQRDDSHSLD